MDSLNGHLPDSGVKPPRSIRRRSRWLAAGATAGALALVLGACGGSTPAANKSPSGTSGAKPTTSGNSGAAHLAGLYGTLPKVGTPTTGGTITVGQLKTSTPTYIMPITPAALASVYTTYDFINLMNQPIYWSPQGATVQIDNSLSIANQPVYSNGNKTVTITIKPWKWSNGTPVTAANVVEFIDVLKAAVKGKNNAANFSNYTPGFFPDNVKSATASGQTLTLQLTKAYNPGYFTNDQLDLVYAMPPQWAVSSAGGKQLPYTNPADAKAIYNYLNSQAKNVSTFATNPLWKISDGPMVLQSFNPTTGAYTMTPNPDFSGPQKARYSVLSVETFTSNQTVFNALQAGTLDIGPVGFSNLPEVSRISGSYNVYGMPDFGFEGMFFNFADKTGHFNSIISQLYIRQALAHLVDQAGYVRGIFKGAAAQGYGPIPSLPKSPYAPANATTNPYPYSTSAAASLLSSHGWSVKPGGQTVCKNAGSGANQCGAGIPAGTPLAWNEDYGNSPTVLGQQTIAFASAAKQVGIEISLKSNTFNNLIAQDNDPSAPTYINKWAMVNFGGFTNSLYPTTQSLFNLGGTYNLGFYNSPTANTLIKNSVSGANPTAVSNEASYLTSNLPVLFLPNPDLIWAVSKKVGGPANGFLNMTQYTWTPQDWYLLK
ncbi:MAG: ABC transporter substrate-binding protein [Actinomycetota bacterium]|nr:ABC transporter substrate-binding protein [Actinomycetota bacterium]